MSPTWRDAWESAHYGPHGFYRANPDPADHFRTAVMDSSEISSEIFDIAYLQYKRLGSPEIFTVVDCGAGSGDLTRDLRLTCKHFGLPWHIESLNFPATDIREIAPRGGAGVVIAHELLDDIPGQVVELDDNCTPHVVHVDPITGTESLGDLSSGEECAWLDTWWPATVPGARREIGLDRDALWRTLLRVFDSGCAVMIDYCTTQPDRARGVFDAGTLTGYRAGRITRPVPDGRMNITAHVCIDSLVEVGRELDKPAAVISRPNTHADFHWLVQQL